MILEPGTKVKLNENIISERKKIGLESLYIFDLEIIYTIKERCHEECYRLEGGTVFCFEDEKKVDICAIMIPIYALTIL